MHMFFFVPLSCAVALLCFHLFSYHIEPSSSFTVIVTADAAHEQRTTLDRSVERGDMSGPYVRVRALGCPVLLLVKGGRGGRKWAPFRFSSVHYILLPSPFFPYLAFTCFVSSFLFGFSRSLSFSRFLFRVCFDLFLFPTAKKKPLCCRLVPSFFAGPRCCKSSLIENSN